MTHPPPVPINVYSIPAAFRCSSIAVLFHKKKSISLSGAGHGAMKLSRTVDQVALAAANVLITGAFVAQLVDRTFGQAA